MDIRPEQVIEFIRETGSDPSPTDDFVAGYTKGGLWKNTSSNAVFLLVDDATPNAAVWQEVTFDASSLSSAFFDAYDSAGTNTFNSGAWVDFVWDVEVLNSGDFTFTPGSAIITATKAAKYGLSFGLVFDQTGGNSRSIWQARLVRDTGGGYVPVPGWLTPVYTRFSARGEGTASRSRLIDVAAGDSFKLQVARLVGGATLTSIADASAVSFSQPSGPKGDKGDPGVGSTVDAQDEGVAVPNGPFDTFNFTGTGVSASDGGSGTLNINVPGLPTLVDDYIAQVGEVNKTGTGFSTILTLNFTTSDPNTVVDLEIYAETRSADGDIPVRLLVELDGTETIMDTGMESEQKQKTWYTDRFAKLRHTVVATGSHSVTLDYASGDSGKQVFVRAGRLWAKEKP